MEQNLSRSLKSTCFKSSSKLVAAVYASIRITNSLQHVYGNSDSKLDRINLSIEALVTLRKPGFGRCLRKLHVYCCLGILRPERLLFHYNLVQCMFEVKE